MPTVLVPLAEGCEELETITIVDLLRRAGIEVTTAALGERNVTGSHDITIVADATLDDVASVDFDMIVLPGGLPGADNLQADSRIRELLSEMASAGRYVAAICAAPRVLAAAGLLDGKHATSYPGFLADYEVDYQEKTVV
ncbi:MAG: DJ-1/PfpI family protein, partial [Gammaproteobacteria bacterium]|nr:DJ-1/PfpI family protein [Gammaproteobacteria bacterium]